MSTKSRCTQTTILFSLFFAFFFCNPEIIKADNQNETFAIVNGQKIPANLFKASYNFLISSKSVFHSGPDKKTNRKQAFNKATDILLNRALLLQDAKIVNALPTEREISEFLENDAAKYGGMESLGKYLINNNIPVDGYREMMSGIFSVQYYLKHHIMAQVNVTKEDCRKYFDENLSKYRPRDQMVISDIIFYLHEGRDNSATIDGIRKIAGSSDFNSLSDSASRFFMTDYLKNMEKNNSLRLDPEKTPFLWRIASQADEGAPVYAEESKLKHHVIYVHRKSFPEKKEFSEVYGEIKKKLFTLQYQILVSEKLDDLREHSTISIIYSDNN